MIYIIIHVAQILSRYRPLFSCPCMPLLSAFYAVCALQGRNASDRWSSWSWRWWGGDGIYWAFRLHSVLVHFAKLIATLFGRLGCQRTLVMSKGDGGKGYEPQPKQMSAFSASVQGVLFLFDFVTLLSFIYRYPFCLQAIAITRRRFRGMADTIHILHWQGEPWSCQDQRPSHME